MLSWDSETHLIRPGLLAPKLVCMSFMRPGERPFLRLAEEGLDVLEAALDSGEILVGHYLVYDFAVACAARPSLLPKVFAAYREGRVRDTKIRQQLLDIAAGTHPNPRGYGLADLEKEHLGRDRSEEKEAQDAWRLRYGELDGLPLSLYPRAAVRYALEDAEGPLAVYVAQGPDVIPTEKEQCAAAWALHLMSVWGIRTDGAAVKELKEVLLQEQAENQIRLKEMGFYKYRKATAEEIAKGLVDHSAPVLKQRSKLVTRKRDIKAGLFDFQDDEGRHRVWTQNETVTEHYRLQKNMEAIGARVKSAYEALGRALPLTDTGQIATDKDTLEQSGDEQLGLLAAAGGIDKILTTYVPAMEHGTKHPINARFNVLVNSGRTSCAEPNLQNLPTGRRVEGVRECFVPRPGHVFVSVDYDTLELRALAQRCLELFGFSDMAVALNAGRDLHTDLAAILLNIPYEEAVARGKKAIKRHRDCAKVGNLGVPGGLGADSLVDYGRAMYQVILTKPEAKELISTMKGRWREMPMGFRWVNRQLGLQETATFTDPVTGFTRGNCDYCAACNFTFLQHRPAMGAKLALFDVAYECYVDTKSPLYGSRPVAFIHDEILMESPKHVANAAAKRLAEVMCAAMARVIPDVPITASPALMPRWYKNAEAAYNDNGELIPWEPEVAA